MRRAASPLRRAAALLSVLAAVSLSGCSGAAYYWQSVSGHVQMLNAARPVGEWLTDTQTPDPLKARLMLSQRIRDFAVAELKLPDNVSYRRYAELNRPSVVWNVVAAPEFSLTLKTWCFPVAGCVGYRGYFSEAAARAEAAEVQARDGLEVGVYGVPAYSTLGWMNWAGGDPLLSTFIRYPEGELARLMFHELAHQMVYASGDTRFNESFATAVERLGVQRWLAHEAAQGRAQSRNDYDAFDERRRQFRALTQRTRRALAEIYQSDNAPAQAEPAQVAIKKIAKDKAMNQFRESYRQLKLQWGGYAGYDLWVAQANNATFGAQAAYDDWVPGFEALFAREGGDWLRFYDAVRQLARQSPVQRQAALAAGPTN